MFFDWLPERLERVYQTGKRLELEFTWNQNPPATSERLKECEIALATIDLRFSPSHRAFLTLCDGAEFVHTRIDEEGELGNTVTFLSSSDIVSVARELNPTNAHQTALGLPHYFWDATLPIVDLQDLNYLVLNARFTTQGESSVFYSNHELGPTWGDGIFYAAPSFEACLMRMLDNVGIRREDPEFWGIPTVPLHIDRRR